MTNEMLLNYLVCTEHLLVRTRWVQSTLNARLPILAYSSSLTQQRKHILEPRFNPVAVGCKGANATFAHPQPPPRGLKFELF